MSDSPEQWGNGGLVGDGRYRLTRRLGRGGMAEVFAAEDVRLGRTVAVKLLRADLAEDPVSKARFTREAQSVAGLNHHAVVAVYDSGEDVVGQNTVPYIVMELVEGRTIRELLLTAEAPPPDQALIIVAGVLEALAYSHQHGIVHRDIKPANVIITHGGAVKVMDFGIARALHGAASTMTQTGMVMGTPQYLSPEQALGKAVDHRSDLYATGCLLYELLALRPPFTGETPLSVVYQHVQDTPVPPSEVAGGVPPELDGLVMRSLAKDPDDRFQSAEEMRGLVQYGLQMLQEAGGYTGTWNTGPVAHGLTGTPPMGVAAAGTAVLPNAAHSDTSQQPLLPNRFGEEDGGYDGSGRSGAGVGRKSGRASGKLLLFVALAVVAVVAGVAFALSQGDSDSGDNKPPADPSPTTTTKTTKSPGPTDESTEEQAPPPPQEDQPGGGGDQSDTYENPGYPGSSESSWSDDDQQSETPPGDGETEGSGDDTDDTPPPNDDEDDDTDDSPDPGTEPANPPGSGEGDEGD